MGHVELGENGQVVFVFPERPDCDGKPTRVPLDEDHVAVGPVAGRKRWEQIEQLWSGISTLNEMEPPA